MALVNINFLRLPEQYLFAEIAKRINVFKTVRPEARLIRLDSGDITNLIPNSVAQALHDAVEQMSIEGKNMIPPKEGSVKMLIDRIIRNDYECLGIKLSNDEVFISSGERNDAETINELVSTDNVLGILSPTYPGFIFPNVMNGRAGDICENGCWSNLTYISASPENNFNPQLPKSRIDIIYLCNPNNPTGTALTRKQLQTWVKYAQETEALIVYDAAYSSYIRSDDVPRSIFEIKGAKKVAIELRSFSKTTGLTGSKYAFAIVPKEVLLQTYEGEEVPLNKLWGRLQTSRYSGLPYLIQKAVEALYTPEGILQRSELSDYYMDNTRILKNALSDLGWDVFGGTDAPFLWMRTPAGTDSWKFFNQMLYEAHVVCTPGVGFSPNGEGFVRLTAFSRRENIIEAIDRLKNWR